MEIIRKYFESIYGEALISIAHFGSRPRETHKPDSDYDFFVILENHVSRDELAEKDQVMNFTEIRDLPLHNHVIHKCELGSLENFLILQDIKNSGIIVYDKDSFLSKEIEKIPNIPIKR